MRALIFGQTGQVARELARLQPGGVIARFLGRADADLRDPAQCAAQIEGCDIVINAAAWTAVDLAESHEREAMAINAAAPSAMAQVCANLGLPMIHLSSDYVFGGGGDRPFSPDDGPAPLNAYGRSKWAGEVGIRAARPRHVILRSSWVYSGHGSNFVTTMLRLGAERARLTVVADQIGGPTPARGIAGAVWAIAEALAGGHVGGTYHFAGAPDTSWAGFARAIMAQAGLACDIVDIPSSQYPTPARRPQNSRLDCASLLADFGIGRPDWRGDLATLIKELRR